LLVAARKAGVQSAALDTRLPRIAEIPFSSERKLMTTVHLDRERDEARIVCVKGAPDVVLAHCSSEFVAGGSRVLTAARRAEIERAIGALADEALRVLGVASRELPGNGSGDSLSTDAASVEDDLVFAGVIGMIDPPRDEAVVAVQRATRAGIRTIMITGDHPRTALVIARELGIPTDGRVLTGAEVTAKSDAELGAVVGKIAVYARIDPLDKLRIVRALQRNGEIVAMTGDGVNDAPALKAADIGVAMGIAGTDVAKEAADIVLTDDNFASIVAAVEEGRAIFANIRSFLRYLLSSNIGEVLAMVCGVMLGPWLGLGARGGELALPLLATQILWINLVTDGPPALALGLEPLDESVVSQPPRPLDERVIPARMWIGIIAMGVVEAVATLVILDASLPGGLISGTGNVAHAQTMVFTTLVLASLFNVFNARSGKRSAFHALFRNRALWGTIVLSLGLQLIVLEAAPLQRAFGTVSLGTADWARCVVAASAVLWMSELAKVAWRFRSSSS
jgi:Ca2+-transporting ATPase